MAISEDTKLDIIYDKVDDLMWARQLDVLDKMLDELSPTSHSTTILLGWLTATLPVKDYLPSRAKLLIATKKLALDRGENEDNLFNGLD